MRFCVEQSAHPALHQINVRCGHSSFSSFTEEPHSHVQFILDLPPIGFPPDAPKITNTKDSLCNLTLSLLWSEPSNGNRPITKYTVYCQEFYSNRTAGERKKHDTTRLQYTRPLSSGTTCQCYVIAFNDQGEGAHSSARNFTMCPGALCL